MTDEDVKRIMAKLRKENKQRKKDAQHRFFGTPLTDEHVAEVERNCQVVLDEYNAHLAHFKAQEHPDE